MSLGLTVGNEVRQHKHFAPTSQMDPSFRWGDSGATEPDNVRHASGGWHPFWSVGMPKQGWVYIMTNRPNGTLYIGLTANLAARVLQNREGTGSAFCRRYGLTRLVHAEAHCSLVEAIAREKAMKAWKRAWKIALIEEHNPGWEDLFARIN